MIKRLFIVLIYLADYWAGQVFYIISYLMGKSHWLISSVKKRIYPFSPCFMELHYLRQEVRRLKYANTLMRQELNRVKTKRPCLCKKLQVIYFKLRFDISLRKISRYLPVSKTALC